MRDKQERTIRVSVFSWAFALVFALLASPSWALSELVVFGDSWSDTGGSDVHRPPNYFGRFSNGPLWVEYLADELSLARPVSDRRVGGKNYARAGAGTAGMASQVQKYLGEHETSGEELFVVLGGINNVRFGTSGSGESAALQIRNDVLVPLISAGANSFLVLNLPPLHRFPIGSSLEVEEEVRSFNTDLAQYLDLLEQDSRIDATFFRYNLAASGFRVG